MLKRRQKNAPSLKNYIRILALVIPKISFTTNLEILQCLNLLTINVISAKIHTLVELLTVEMLKMLFKTLKWKSLYVQDALPSQSEQV